MLRHYCVLKQSDSLCLTGLEDVQRLELTGFGASAHLIMKMVRYKYPATKVYVFACSLGATWAGDTLETSRVKLHAIIDTTQAWTPLINSLGNLDSGGHLIINVIRKEDSDKQALRDIQYPMHLWQQKEIKSAANVTRADVKGLLALAAAIPLNSEIQQYKIEGANKALQDLKTKKILEAQKYFACRKIYTKNSSNHSAQITLDRFFGLFSQLSLHRQLFRRIRLAASAVR